MVQLPGGGSVGCCFTAMNKSKHTPQYYDIIHYSESHSRYDEGTRGRPVGSIMTHDLVVYKENLWDQGTEMRDGQSVVLSINLR